MYAVKINPSNRFISYCDNCWYETSGTTPIYLFSKERAEEIVRQMKSHYEYDITIVGDDGTEDRRCRTQKTNPMKETTSIIKSFRRKF